MTTILNYDWAKLRNPNDKFFKLFLYNERNPMEYFDKVNKFAKMLMEKPLYISDEFRTPTVIAEVINRYFDDRSIFNFFYEVGDFQGFVGFTHIIPTMKCGFLFEIWDKDFWSKELARAGKDLLELYMKEFQFERMVFTTPDEKMKKLGEMMGFKVEGEHYHDFRWNGIFYNQYTLAYTKEKQCVKTEEKTDPLTGNT